MIYSIPDENRVYAVGDIHGYPDGLEKMLRAILKDIKDNPIANINLVFVGDYVDRGPDSAGVIERLIRLKEEVSIFETVFLKGNHEVHFQGFMRNPEKHLSWFQYGGIDCMQSYGVHLDPQKPFSTQLDQAAKQLFEAVPETHHAFLDALSLKHEIGDYAFVHAGIRPGIPLSEQSERDLTFIRDVFLESAAYHEKRIVHGHTIVEEPEILPNRINIDTGLYAYGRLSCAVLEGEEVRILSVYR